jgi:probable biosynthetic protein (TIGR04099 family)
MPGVGSALLSRRMSHIACDNIMLRTSSYLIGMPHLSFVGLSENWLLKQCGDLHWSMLAERMGAAASDLRDIYGRRLYAAFVAIQLEEYRLDEIREDDRLEIASDLTRISRAQFRSAHAISVKGGTCGRVEMISVFVRRSVEGSNRGVEKGVLGNDRDDEIGPVTSSGALVRAAKQIRSENWSHMGFSPQKETDLAVFEFKRCRYGDFNGAKLLYFASFQSIVDRAESFWWPQAFPIFLTSRRDLFYHSNIDVGESITVRMKGFYEDGVIRRHWTELRRGIDNNRIADIFTTKIITKDINLTGERHEPSGQLQRA